MDLPLPYLRFRLGRLGSTRTAVFFLGIMTLARSNCLVNSWDAFVVGLAASIGAGISMGFAEALSDDGSLTGRGHPWVRGLICGLMTALGGVGHTLPFLIRDFAVAMVAAVIVVLVELGVITWIRHRFMETPVMSAALQVGLGGALVFLTGVLIGSS